MATVHDLYAGPIGLDDEGGDSALTGARHHDDEIGDGPVGAPQFLAVENVGFAVLAGRRRGRHAGGIAPHFGFGEGECADGSLGEPREVFLFLLRCSEEFERLRHADGLVGREQYSDRALPARHERNGLVVACLGKSETAVLGRDLDAERAQLGEAVDDVLRYLGIALYLFRIGVVSHERGQLFQKRLGPRGFLWIHRRIGVDEIEVAFAFKKSANEAGSGPLLLSGGFGNLPCFQLGNLGVWWFSGPARALRRDGSHAPI